MKVHYKIKLLTVALAVLLNSHNAQAAQEAIDAAGFIRIIPTLANSAHLGLVPAYSAEGIGDGTMWQGRSVTFNGEILPNSDFVQAVIALRQPGIREKTDFSRDIFAHVTIAILNQRGVTSVSLGMLADTSNMGRHVRSVQRAIGWDNTDMQTVMEALGYTGIVHLSDGIDFADEEGKAHATQQSIQNATHKAGKDVEKVVQNVVQRPMKEVKRFLKKW